MLCGALKDTDRLRSAVVILVVVCGAGVGGDRHNAWCHDQSPKWYPTVLTGAPGDRGRGVWVDSRRDGAPDAAPMRRERERNRK